MPARTKWLMRAAPFSILAVGVRACTQAAQAPEAPRVGVAQDPRLSPTRTPVTHYKLLSGERVDLFARTGTLLYRHFDDVPAGVSRRELEAAWRQTIASAPSFDLTDFGIESNWMSAKEGFPLWIIDVSSLDLSQESILALCDRMAARPDTRFVSPVFETEKGGGLFPLPEIIAYRTANPPDMRTGEEIARTGVGVVAEWEMPGLPRHILIAANAKTGLDVYRDRERVEDLPFVEWADVSCAVEFRIDDPVPRQ